MGDAVFNILIRTAFIHKRKMSVRAGAGIVADSRAAREYQEIGAKACALLKAAGYDLQK
jgi:anthranilate synthase component 1